MSSRKWRPRNSIGRGLSITHHATKWGGERFDTTHQGIRPKAGSVCQIGTLFLEPSLVLKRSPRCKKMNLATHKFITRRSWKSKTDVLEAGLSCAPAGRMLERIIF